ncbi:MAG: glutathione S-transferase family protein [Pseudomonadota bacterium]|nr:glutathione S-transferase family protein [Pseudomonadota bacterium]
MRKLYHLWLNPFSRKVRIVLAEMGLDFEMVVEQVWERRQGFLALNPAGEVPVLVEPDDTVLSDSQAICEYLDELKPELSLMGQNIHKRAEVRRLVTWFDRKFDFEVGGKLVGEKVMKRFLGLGKPDSAAIRAAQKNIHTHLEYIAFLIDRRHWLGGEEMTLADITAAAHLSTVDYLGDVPWAEHKLAKNWYTRIKSRPSLRPILAERIPRLPAAPHYSDLDF